MTRSPAYEPDNVEAGDPQPRRPVRCHDLLARIAPDYDPNTTLRTIRFLYHMDRLVKLADLINNGRALYRYVLPGKEVIYPVIAPDGFIVTILRPHMLVHTTRGREWIADLEDAL